MTERLSDVEARITSVRQLSSVITAMRSIAAARAHEAAARLPGVRAYAATIGQSIAQALAVVGERQPPPGATPRGRHLVIALCAEQGFVGPFNARVLDAARGLAGGTERVDLMVVGSRGLGIAEERGLGVDWSAAMATHTGQLTALANRLADALFGRLEDSTVGRATIVHARPADGGEAGYTIAQVALLPFDFGRFAPVSLVQPPIIQLPAPTLLARLADEYVFAQLCEAVTLSYAAENDARMRAMIAARENVRTKLDELTGDARRLRQEQITEEVIELAAGAQG